MKPFQASWMIGSLDKGLILLGLMAVATGQAQTNKSYEAHVLEVQKRAPAGFTILIERPFIVVGNEEPAMVREHAENTIRWAVNRLKKDFFSRDPAEIIDI